MVSLDEKPFTNNGAPGHPNLAAESAIALPAASDVRSKIALARAGVPSLTRISKSNRVHIKASGCDVQSVGQLARKASGLQTGDGQPVRTADFGLNTVFDADIESVVAADAVFVLLMLSDVKSAPAANVTLGRLVGFGGGSG